MAYVEGQLLPEPDAVSAPFWDACTRHELRAQRCLGCGTLRWLPRPMCPVCMSMDHEWAELTGKGRVHSWVVVHGPVLPAFESRLPMPVVLVDLDEGIRMLGGLVETDPDTLSFDDPVEVVFEDVTDDVSLPGWRRVSP